MIVVVDPQFELTELVKYEALHWLMLSILAVLAGQAISLVTQEDRPLAAFGAQNMNPSNKQPGHV